MSKPHGYSNRFRAGATRVRQRGFWLRFVSRNGRNRTRSVQNGTDVRSRTHVSFGYVRADA
jgi:hypothetical protein